MYCHRDIIHVISVDNIEPGVLLVIMAEKQTVWYLLIGYEYSSLLFLVLIFNAWKLIHSS